MSSYDGERLSFSRTKIDLIKLNLPFCGNTYGVAPCTANGTVKCFNTFLTCQDKDNYNNVGKTYKYVNEKLPVSVINEIEFVNPFVKDINDLATEIKENNTVVKRLKVSMYDDADNGVGTDPYISERMPAKGFYWRKFIQRNKNYRRGTIEHLRGFAGISEDQYQTKFAGKIDNISFNGTIEIEGVDFLKELANLDYPLKLNLSLADDLPKTHVANSETAMLALEAYQNDYCKRTEFNSIAGASASEVTATGGTVPAGTYNLRVYAFDVTNNALARSSNLTVVVNQGNAIFISWSAYSGASYYQVFIKSSSANDYTEYYKTISISYTIDDLDKALEGTPPVQAAAYYQLTGEDPSVIGNWDVLYAGYTFYMPVVGDTWDELPESGYVRVEKEIFHYNGKTTIGGIHYLTNLLVAQEDTESTWHYEGSAVAFFYTVETPTIAYTVLKEMLALTDIDESRLSDRFLEYESGAFDEVIPLYVTLKPIFKDIKFSRLYFDLVRLLDCMSWVNEDGKIDILKYGDYTLNGAKEITDEENIIAGSVSVDYNEPSRLTRWVIARNRYDLKESIDEIENYNAINVVVDSTAESDNEYGDTIEDVQLTVWLNEDSDTEENMNSYVESILENRRERTRDAREIVELSVEMKDSDIRTGQVILLSTKYLNDIYGNNYSQVPFRVMKSEMMENKNKLKLIRLHQPEGSSGGITSGEVSGGGASGGAVS